MEELKQLLTDKQYQPLLQGLNRVLGLKGKAASGYDRGELLLLKGEALLQTKQTTAAIDVFESVVKQGTEAKGKEMGQAMALLVRRSPGGKYTPKTKAKDKPAASINILDPDQRKAALSAMLVDELADLQPKVKSAGQSKALPPILALVDSVEKARQVELAATDQDGQARQIGSDLADRARDVMAAEIRRLSERTEAISKIGEALIPFNEMVQDRGRARMETHYRKHGLNTNELNELRQIAAMCDQVEPIASKLAEGLQLDAKDFRQAVDDAERVKKRAREVLDTDYTGVLTNPGPANR